MAAVLALFDLVFIAFLDVVRRVCTRSWKVEGAPGSKESRHARSCLKARDHPLVPSSVDCMKPWSHAGPWRRILCARPMRLVERVGAVAALERRLSLHHWYGCLLALILSKAGGERSGNNWRDFAWERLTSGPKCHSGKVVGRCKVTSRLAICL